jgi:hypothetical protein
VVEKGLGTTGNPKPKYPSDLQSGDLILLQVVVEDTSTTPTTPTILPLYIVLTPQEQSANGFTTSLQLD